MYRKPRNNYMRDYMAKRRQAERGDNLMPPPDRRVRPLSLCQKGECRWLDHQCLRPSGPCPQVSVPGPDCPEFPFQSRRTGQVYRCTYYRSPCNRRLYNCPFGHRIQWRCEECGDWILIGDIHFVHDGLRETKHRFIARTQKDASAICGGCLERLRQHHKDDPRSWLKGIGQLRSESLYGI